MPLETPKKTLILLELALAAFGIFFSLARAQESPAFSWMNDWNAPPMECRPLQIVHHQPLFLNSAAATLRQRGLGGVVVSINPDNGYVRNEEHWKTLRRSIEAAREEGLRVWFYDERTWPSLAAGGAVLERDPSLESLELAYDAENKDEPFTVRTSYEYTFASSDKLRPALRHPNPLDPKATETFLDTTHRKLRETLEPNLYHQVEAFFTDEPTLLGCRILGIPTPEEREKYGIFDPLDWSKKLLPTVPWREGLEDDFQAAYHYPLNKIDLFTGDTDQARQTRRDFWSLIGRIHAQAYLGTIRAYCESDPLGPKSSGHTLLEEWFRCNIPCDGNKFEVLKQMQIPGQDLLTSVPKNQLENWWLTNALPTSAGYMIGERKAMTEVSCFDEESREKRQATLAEKRATAGIMASWGITEFTLYYPLEESEVEHAYTDFVGRLNAILRQATPQRPLLLYYAIENLQEGYRPQKESIFLNPMTDPASETAASFEALGSELSKRQIPFFIADAQTLNEFTTKEMGTRTVRGQENFTAVIAPCHADIKKECPELQLPIACAATGKEFFNKEKLDQLIEEYAGPRLLLTPQTKALALGAFIRDGKLIFTLTNADSETAWSGTARLLLPNDARDNNDEVQYHQSGAALPYGTGSRVTIFNPENGEITPAGTLDNEETLPLTIPALETRIVVVEQVE